MQDYISPLSLENAIALQKYGVGQSVHRKEDDTLLRGKGRYTDDFSLPDQTYGWVVRSSHAHGVETSARAPALAGHDSDECRGEVLYAAACSRGW